MTGSVEELKIEINSEATKANDAIDKLSKKLDVLSASIGRLGGADFSNFSTGVKQLSGAMQGLSNVKLPDYTRLSKGIEKLGALDSATIARSGQAIGQLGVSLEKLDKINISDNAKQITEFSKGVSKLGNTSAQKAVDNIPKLAAAMNDLMKTLSKAPKVSQNLIDMTNALGNLARTGASSGKAAKSLNSAFDGIYSSSINANKGLNILNGGFGRLFKSVLPILGIHRLFQWGKDAIQISSDLEEVQNVVDVTFGKYKNMIEDMAKTSITDFGMSELTTKQIGSRFQAMGNSMGIAQEEMAEMSISLTQLAADMASFYNVEQAEMSTSLQSVFTGETEPLRKYGLDLAQVNIQQWAMTNGLNANMKAMSGAEKTMLRYAYVMANTSAAQGDFARTSQSWANSLRVLRQNFEALGAVVGGTLINALKPFVQALNSVMGKVIEFATTVSNALGKIFGWKIQISSGGVANDIVGSSADIADNLGSGASNAKEQEDALKDTSKAMKKLRDYTLGIDELNIISPEQANALDDAIGKLPDLGGSGGGLGNLGGSGGGADAQLVKTDTIFKDYESELDTLYKLGEYIGNALSGVMESINWDSVYEKARNFGTGLADFLNGLISPRLFGNVGKTIAGSLNTAIYASLSFAERFDWTMLGISIGTGINEFFNTFDFSSAAESINAWAKGLLNTAISALETTDWYMIGTKIGEFLVEIDFLEIGFKVGEAIWKAINAGFEVLEGMFETAPLETAIIGLGSAFARLPKLFNVIAGTKLIKFFTDAEKRAASFYGIIWKNLSPALSRVANAFKMSTGHGATFLQGLNASFTALQRMASAIPTLTKGVVGLGAGFSEFFAVKDAISDIVLGVGDLGANIGQLGIAVAGAGTALSVVFGFPAGLIATGVVAAVGAIAGLNSAFDKIDAEKFGLSVKNALTVPGGVPLETIVDGVRNSISSIGDSFTFLSEQSVNLDAANGNIKNTWLEIEKIETAMRSGVLSVEEGTAQLTAQFEILAQSANEKFTSMENTILAAYGENGALNSALNRLGVSYSNVVGETLGLTDAMSQKLSELSAEMATLDPTNPRYAELRQQMAELTLETDSLTMAMQSGAAEINSIQIDFSKLVPMDDGTLDTGYFEATMGSLVQTVTSTQSEIGTSTEALRVTLQEGLKNAISLGDTEAITAFETQLSALPEAVSLLKNDIGTEALGVSDALQNQLIGNIDIIISDAEARWSEMSYSEKLFSGFDSAAEYAQNAVTQYKTQYIDPLTASINEQYAQLGIEGAGWASGAADSIVNGLFTQTTTAFETGRTTTGAQLNENYKQIIESATARISELAATRGSEVVQGFDTGLEEGQSTSAQKVDAWMSSVDTAIHDSVMAFGSPSRRTWEYAKGAIDGFNNGILENMASSQSAINQWMESINAAFSANGDKSMFSGIGESLKTTWTESSTWWKAEIQRWHSDDVLPWFDSEKWALIYASIKTSLQLTWDETLTWWNAAIYRWYNDDVATWFTKDKWTWPGIKDGLVASFEAATEAVKQVWNSFANHMNQNLKMKIDPIVVDGKTVFSGQEIVLGKFPTFASGGLPDIGDIFIANEFGPELIGTINGRPAVVGYNEISGIRDAVYDSGETNAQLLNTVIELLQIVASKELSVNIGDREIVEANRRGEARMGYRFT